MKKQDSRQHGADILAQAEEKPQPHQMGGGSVFFHIFTTVGGMSLTSTLALRHGLCAEEKHESNFEPFHFTMSSAADGKHAWKNPLP